MAYEWTEKVRKYSFCESLELRQSRSSGDFNCNYLFNDKQIVIRIVITICLCYTDIREIRLIIDRRTGDAEKRHGPDGAFQYR